MLYDSIWVDSLKKVEGELGGGGEKMFLGVTSKGGGTPFEGICDGGVTGGEGGHFFGFFA